MKMTCYPVNMELSIPSELGYETIARDAVAAFALRLGFAPDRVEDLKTALCEACINAIEHGNLMSPGLRVHVSCVCDNERLLVEICDQGLQSYASKQEPLSISEKMAGLGSLRGMGLLLIEQLVDEAGFVTDAEDSGNCFRFSLYRRSAVITHNRQEISA